MKVMIAMDSFKGSLSSNELAGFIAEGIKTVFHSAEIVKIPVADGGEGTTAALVEETKGKIIKVKVKGPLTEDIEALYGVLGNEETVIIEMAAASGLPLVPEDKRNPMKTTTYGTGQLILDAIEKGYRNFIIGIGGSATNDAGLGMLGALGYKFSNSKGKDIPLCGKGLLELAKIDLSGIHPSLKECHFEVACDVKNPLHGPNGAAYIYGPQKGATPEIVEKLDKGLVNFSEVVEKALGKRISDIPGAGAAGGLGAAFIGFLNSELKPGVDIVLEHLNFKERVADCDFVITGEGKIDSQTAMGKTPVGVAKLAAQEKIPVLALAGCLADDFSVVHNHGITSAFSIINYPISLEEAMNKEKSGYFIKKNTEEIFRLIKACKDTFSIQT